MDNLNHCVPPGLHSNLTADIRQVSPRTAST
jgi:hypothetical protein